MVDKIKRMFEAKPAGMIAATAIGAVMIVGIGAAVMNGLRRSNDDNQYKPEYARG